MSAELAARRTAAAAVLGDYQREVRTFVSDDTGTAPEPDAIAWAGRLAAELRSLLEQLDAENPEPVTHPFVRPGQVAAHLPAPDNCMRCGQPEAAHAAQPRLDGTVPILTPEADRATLTAIRAVFEVFDWETDDRQYALEQIEDIISGGNE
jgi:hypothetical protein